MDILIGILAAIGFLGLYSRLQDIKKLKKRVETLEERVKRLEEKVGGIGDEITEKTESL